MCYSRHVLSSTNISFIGFSPTKFPIFYKNKERSIATRTDTTVNNDQAVVWEFAPQTKEEAMMRLLQSPRLYKTYQEIKSEKWKTRILDFFAGNQSLPLTYDPFFTGRIFPDST